MKQALLLLLFAWALVSIKALHVHDGAPPIATSLQCGYLERPIGIDVPNPRLSWSLSHPSRGQKQVAFQVQVATSSNFEQQSIVWDSKISNSSKPYTTYGSVGTPKQLVSDTSYYWRIQWWDLSGASSGWASSSFDTGLFKQTDWKGIWIGGNGNLLRKEVTIPAAPKRARAFVSGLGYYELFINGQRVGDARLDPGWTTYDKRVLYNVYDVTSLLKMGDNAIGVSLGHGWYGSTETKEPNGPLSLIFQISVDGKILAPSDTTWSIASGPIVYDHIYNGETYDARLEQPGWNNVGFKPQNAWASTTAVRSPGGVLSYQMIPPIRVKTQIKPIGMTNPANNTYVIDFGQNFSGWCLLTITGAAGTSVKLRHAEVLQHSGNGMIYTDNLRSAKATDIYILKGDKNGEVHEPSFTYHGFRYVEFSATPPIVPTLSTLLGRHLHSDVDKTGDIQFQASSNILNMIQKNTVWGQESNLMSLPTDCDQRDERKGWMGDAQLTAEEAIHNFYMPAFYVNFLNLIRDVQENGTITDTVPWTFGSRPADPAWGSAYPSIVYWVWKYYDDIELVKSHYNNLRDYIDYLTAQATKTGIGKFFFNYGDWVPPPPSQGCSQHLTSAFSYIANLRQFIEMAQAVGNTADYTKYTSLANSAATQFNANFFNTATNIYDIGVQTAMTLPLWLDIVPAASKSAVINNLLNDIVATHDTHLSTGIIGTKYLMETLHWLGRDDIALQIAENVDYPSWGYMAVNPIEPATTLWELWDTPSEGPGMNSRSHIMFGSVSDWFYKALAGVTYGETGHFDTINISPGIVGDLTAVSASFQTGQGVVSSQFTRVAGGEVCATGAEGQMLTIDCSATGVIIDIKFASFGLPHGQCGHFGHNTTCSAGDGAKQFVTDKCVGLGVCSFMITESEMGVVRGCEEFSRMYVEAVCSKPFTSNKIGDDASAAAGYQLSVKIPVGSVAKVTFPKLDLSDITITEGGSMFWQKGSFRAGVAGVTSASLVGADVVAVVGSGEYKFSVVGNKGVSVCGAAPETNTVNLQCPSGQSITYVSFASFGNPSGTCGNYRKGDCDAGSALTLVKQACLLKNSCSVAVDAKIFGDPCFKTPKEFAVEVVCSV